MTEKDPLGLFDAQPNSQDPLGLFGDDSDPLGLLETKTTIGEDVGIGFKSLGHMSKDALDLLAGAAATHLGGDPDSIYADMEARNKAWQEEQAKKEQGFSGKVVSGLTQLAPAVAAMPFVGPAPAMGVLSGMSALSQGGRNVQSGADAMTQAVPQAIAEGALDMTAAKLIPGGSGILKGATYGAGGNLVATIGQDLIAPNLLPEQAQAFYKPDMEKYAVSGITGALPGAAIGHIGAKVQDNPYNAPPKIEKTPGLDVDADMTRRVNSLRSTERAIRDQLERQSDQNSDYSLQLREELRKTTGDLIQLEKLTGATEISVGKTTQDLDAAAALERQAAQERVRAAEQEMSALQTEHNTIKAKGAALTVEDKARLAVIESRFDSLADEAERNAAKAFGEEETPNQDMSAMFQKQAAADRAAEGGVDVSQPINKPNVGPSTLLPGLSEKANKYRSDLLKQLQWWEWKAQSDPSTYSGLVEKTKQKITEIENSVNRPEFVPGRTKIEVHQKHSEIDIQAMSDAALAQALATKQAKVDKVDATLASLAENGGSLDKVISVQRYRNLLNDEAEDFRSELDLRKMRSGVDKAEGNKLSAMLFNDYIAMTPFIAGARGALNDGGIVNALSFIGNYGKTLGKGDYGRFYGALAKTILNNPHVASIKHRVDPSAVYGAQYNNHTGEIIFKSQGEITPSAILHETTHALVNRAVGFVRSGMGHHLDPRALAATRKLFSLHNKVRTNRAIREQFDQILGADNAKIVLSNEQEFLAYGLTDNKVQNALRQIKSDGKSFWSTLKDTLKDFFGESSNTRTALDDVLEYGQSLIDLSTAQPPKGLMGIDPQVKFRIKNTPEAMLQSIRNGSLKVFSHLFTAQLPQVMRNDKHFNQWSKTIKDVQWKAESLKTKLLGGVRAPQTKGFFYNLKGPKEEAALVPTIHRIAKDADIADVHDKMIDGYERGIDHEQTIAAHQAGWTPDQAALAKALAKNVDTLYEEAVRMYGRTDLDQDLKKRIGYMLTSRVGDYDVEISIQGVPLRKQSFLTAGEANYWAKVYTDSDPRIKAVPKAKERDMTQNLIDFIESLSNVEPGGLRDHLNKQLLELERNNTSIGGHTNRSMQLPGFVGDQAGLTKAQRGKLLREAMPRAFNQYVDNIASREIQKKLIEFHIDNDDAMKGTTRELVDFYTRSQIDRPYKTDRVRSAEGGDKAHATTVREHLHDLSTGLRELTTNAWDKNVVGYHMRDKHAIDRLLGMFSSVFYVANITMKPAIWLAQPMQALMATRSSFKNQESVRQALAAFGETVYKLAGQRWAEDPDFAEALQKVSAEHNTLHPQMNNEFNSITIGHNPDSILNKTIDHGLGRTISAAGDKFSRFASFTYFYNLHKRSGLTGDELIKKSAQDATDNMIAYGSKNLPAIYRELGIFGEQASPLMTFAHGQLGNMLVDIKEFASKPSFRTSAPLILTSGIMMIMGGAISLPILAEYELIRQAAIAAGLIRADSLPSVTKLMIDYTPSWISHGAFSGATGVDIDASMRYTSLFKKLTDVEEQGMMSFFPHLNWGAQALSGATTLAKSAIVDTPKADVDRALKQALPKGPVYGTVEYFRNKDTRMVPMGAKGGALVERKTPELLAPFVGSRSLLAAKDAAHIKHAKDMSKSQKELETKFAQYASQGYTEKSKQIIDILMNKYYKGDSNQLKALIEKQITEENVPALWRMYADKAGNSNPQQQSRFMRDNAGPYIQNRER